MATTTTVARPLPNSDDVWGRHRILVLNVTIDDQYPTGGFAFDPKAYAGAGSGPVLIVAPHFMGTSADDSTGAVPQFDYVNNKILLKQVGLASDALQEVPNACAAFLGKVMRVLVVFGV